MANKRLLKELKQISNSKNDDIISLNPIVEDNLFYWSAIIHPTSKDSYYFNYFFKLDIDIPQSYPLEPPKIKFNNNNNNNRKEKEEEKGNNFKISNFIPHCNVDIKTGEICLDILKHENWSPAWSIETAIVAVLVLLDNPEPNSPLNVDISNLFKINDKIAIKSIINYYLNR